MNPFISVIHPDPRLAAQMSRVYHDILDQSIQYFYWHLLTEGLDNEASELFLALSEEDRKQVHAIGRLIRALGGNPGISMRTQTPRIDLSGDASCRALPVVRRILRQALQSEALMITELESLSAMAEEEAVVAVLRTIIAETQSQYERLEMLARKIS